MKNELERSIGGRIKLARQDMGLSQMDLAKMSGFESATAISLIENNERNVNVETLQKIADALHRNIKYFLGEDEKIVTTEFALRADPHLSKEDKDVLLHLVEMAKKRKNGK